MKYKKLIILKTRKDFFLSLPTFKKFAIVGSTDAVEVEDALANSEPSHLFLIDDWQDDGDSERYKELRTKFNEDFRVHYFHVNAVRMARAFSIGELDIVKIRDSPDYNTNAHRLESYWRTLRNDGILCGEGYETNEQMKKAVDDFLKVRGFETVNYLTKDDYSCWAIFRR